MILMQHKYKDKRTARFAAGERVKEFESFKDQAEKRLDILEASTDLNDLRRMSSNRFEALGGDRNHQFSIAINLQWRICFEWAEHDSRPSNIEIVDYH
jgi:toxin HigB-1